MTAEECSTACGFRLKNVRLLSRQFKTGIFENPRQVRGSAGRVLAVATMARHAAERLTMNDKSYFTATTATGSQIQLLQKTSWMIVTKLARGAQLLSARPNT